LLGLLRPDHPMYRRGWDGLLIYDRVEGRIERHAILHRVVSGDEIVRLYAARVGKVRYGGVLILGTEMHFRASKSKGQGYRQTWWCIPRSKTNRVSRDANAA